MLGQSTSDRSTEAEPRADPGMYLVNLGRLRLIQKDLPQAELCLERALAQLTPLLGNRNLYPPRADPARGANVPGLFLVARHH